MILAHGGSTVGPLQQASRTVPIVFVSVTDPVGAGYVESLARPGGNATGFMANEYSLYAKYPELLKEIAPGIARVAVLRDPSQGASTGDFAVIEAMAPLLRVQVTPINLREAGEIESAGRIPHPPAVSRQPQFPLIARHRACQSARRSSGLILRIAR